jgi:hypothetical protein
MDGILTAEWAKNPQKINKINMVFRFKAVFTPPPTPPQKGRGEMFSKDKGGLYT